MSAQEIKYPALDANLPQNNELREYLATKAETGMHIVIRPSRRKLVRAPMDRYPRMLLVMPPITLSEGTVKRVIPPLGLTYIGGYLESVGIPFDILDCVVEGLDTEQLIGDRIWMYGLTDEAIREYLERYNPEIVGISIIYSSDLHSMYRLAQLAKAVNPNVVVVVGGIHPSIYPREVLGESKPFIDYVIRGEGEIRLAEFIENFRRGEVDFGADGLCGWEDGTMFLNPQISTIQNLDDMPLPAYHRLPMEKYFAFNVPFSPFPRGNRVMQVYTSRGCPVGCTFCASTNFNKAFRSRSPQKVVEEIMYYKEKFGIDEIQFADDNLTFNRKRAMEFFDALKACGLPWCTPNGTMVNTLTEDLLEKMIDSGLYQVTLSLDSGNAKTLKELHRKPVNLERVPDLAAYLKARGILIHATLVVGMPSETIDDINEGYRFVQDLPLDSIGVFIAQALPGSELFETAVAAGQINRKEARIIDTARNNISLSDIDQSVLEKNVSDFLMSYNATIKLRDPESWEKKYKKHRDRLSRICIGKAAPNTGGIINAARPAPMENYSY